MRFNRILLYLLLLSLLVIPASAIQQMFTNLGDDYNIVYTGNAYWYRSAGSNNYAYGPASNGNCGIRNKYPFQTTYSAVTITNAYSAYQISHIRYYDANANLMADQEIFNIVTGRHEMKMSGGTPKIYINGVFQENGPALAQNPSYVEWQEINGGAGVSANFDDYVIGEPGAMLMSLPEGNNETTIILKDIVNPAQSGLAFGENATIINSNYMGGTWARGNATIGGDVAQPNETIELRHLGTGTVYATNYTGTGLYGSMTWNIKTMLIDSGAPQGDYGLYRPSTGEYGDIITFKSNGASVAWSQPKYSVGDESSVIYFVLDGGYWDLSSFSYKVVILDPNYQFKQNSSLTSSSGTITYPFTENDIEGVYHAWLIATNHNGYEYILGADYTELVAFFGYGGNVSDGYTGLPIDNANITFTQGLSAAEILHSGPDGNYSSEPVFTTGSSVFVNATQTGYTPYQYSWVPLSSGTVSDLGITLYPIDPLGPSGGIGIGGVVRDKTIGRPIPDADVPVFNETNGQFYYKKTNAWGGYVCDPGTSCGLVANRLYFVNASKIGYNTSINYPVIAAGAI